MESAGWCKTGQSGIRSADEAATVAADGETISKPAAGDRRWQPGRCTDARAGGHAAEPLFVGRRAEPDRQNSHYTSDAAIGATRTFCPGTAGSPGTTASRKAARKQ